MKHAVAVAFAIAASFGPRVARADDDPDRRPTWEGAFGIAMGTMQVGKWNPIDIGFEARGGIRWDRFALLGELDYTALWPASWRHGTIDVDANNEISGSMLRGALVARYSFAKYVGAWHKDQRLTNAFYVEGELGEQYVAADQISSFGRHDLALGIGYLMDARLGRRSGRMVGFYAFHVIWAPSANTPDATKDGPGFPGAGARDIGITFDFGLAFGG